MKTVEEIRRENLKALSEKYGSTQALADKIGRSNSQVSQWITGAIRSQTGKPSNISKESARRIEDSLGLGKLWMDQDHSKKSSSVLKLVSDQSDSKFDANVVPISNKPSQKKLIPVLSKVQAGEWTKSNDMDELSDHDEWVDDYSGKWKPCLFALEVTGDSMMGDDPTHSFPEGGYVVCDPEQIPTAGQYCIAKNTLTQKTTFKRFDSDGFNSFLTALNKDYPKIPIDNGNIRIIARAIEYVPKKPKPIKL